MRKPGSYYRVQGIAILTIVLVTGQAKAQFKKEKLMKPVLSVSDEYVFGTSMEDTSGEYGFHKPSLGLKLPLYTRLGKGRKAGSFGYWGIFLNAGGSYTWPDFSWLPASRQLFNAHAGLSGIWYPGGKSVYLGGITASVSEDNRSMNNPLIRYSGSLMLVHRVSPLFAYLAGASYSFVYGTGLPLPILGGRFSFGRRNRLNILLPFSVTYSYRVGDQNRLSVFLRPSGGVSRVTNDGLFPGEPSIVNFRQRVFRIGASFLFYAGYRFGINPEIGWNGKRRLYFTPGDEGRKDALAEGVAAAGPYVKLSLLYRFGANPYHGDNDAINYLMENGIDSLPLDGDEKLSGE